LGLDKLIGLITISEEKTRQAPEVIGSAWQSIIARIGKITAKVDLDDLVDENGKVVATINDADKVLSKYGINLVDTSGKMRDMGTIMDEIGAKWGQMSTLEQNQLAYVVAGVRQRNVFIAAMEDYNKVLEATEVSQNANGVAAEKMTVYNESLEAAQNRLTASVQQFAQDSNLDRTLALAYDGLSKVVEILNILLNKIPVLSPLIKALGVALATAFAGNILKNIWETSNLIGQLPSLAITATSAIGALNTTLFTIGSVAVPIWGIVAAITAIGAVAKVAWNAWKDAQPEAQVKKANEALQESQQNLDETNNKITEINKQISEINSKGTLTLADEQQKENLQEQLDVLKEIQKTQNDVNEANKAVSKEKTQGEIKSRYGDNKSVEEYQSSFVGIAPRLYDAESASVNQLLANIAQLNKEKQNLDKTDENYATRLQQLNSQMDTQTLALQNQKLTILQDMQTLQNLGDTSSDVYKMLQEQLDTVNLALDPSNFETIKVQNLIDTSGISDKLQEAVQAGDEAGQKTAEAYANKFAQQILNSDDSIKAAWAQAMNIDVNDLNIDNLTQELLTKFQQMYGQVNQAIFELTSEQVADWTTEATNALVTQDEAMKDYISTVANVTEKQEILNAAYSEMKEKGELSVATVQKLIEQEPSLVSALTVENGHIRINIDSLQDLSNGYFNTAIETKKQQITQTQSVIDETKKRIEAINQEMIALGKLIKKRIEAGEKVSATDLDTYRGQQKTEYYLKQQGKQAQETKDDLQEQLDALTKLEKAGLTYTPSKGKSSGKSGSSGKSAADKAAKEFEDSIKDKVKNLKSIVQLYSENANWDDPTVIKEFQDRYDKLLNEVINDPKARKVLADAFNLDISNMPVEQQIQELTTLWQKQAGTIQESYQKLLKNLAKEDLSSAKAVIEKYKDGIYGAWSSDEALNAAKADYQKFIDKITNDADYRAAMAEALNLGDISGEPVEKQIEAVINALQKSTGTLDDAQQDLYDDASKNIKALQDEIEDMIDTAIDLLEKAGDFLFDMLDKISDRYDAQIDNLDKISDELDDQKDAFEDKIDQQKELLKLQKEEMDNADELAEKNKSIADIDAQLMELQYDNSAEAQAKRLKLLDERAEKEKDLADWQKDNDYNTKIDALDKEKSEYEKTIEAEKKAIEAQKQTLQDAQKQFETTLGNIQNGFNTFIKILSSDLVKNLISKALINTGSDTVTNLLTGYNKLFGSGIDTDVTGKINAGYKSLNEIGGKITNGLNLSGVSKNINSSLEGIVKNFGNFSNGINRVIQPGIQSVSNIFSNFGNVLRNSFSLDWNGITNSMSGGLKVVSSTFSSMFNPIAKGASAIGDAIGAGITGFFPGIFTALGTLVTTVGTAMSGVLNAIATAMSSIPVVGWAIAAAAVVGAVALVASIASIVSKTKSSKVARPTQSFTAKKHHTGADYVKKENPALDKMLGLNDDETVSILKVGEAVVPTWANNATSSASSNRFTGSPFSSAVDTAIKSANTNTKTYSSSDNSTINISMPINIQGDADISTVNSLKKEADNIVNRVLKKINNQTKIGGYKNIKAATV
jgi:phage-related protein